jgi:GT2 family glycosyltransferase
VIESPSAERTSTPRVKGKFLQVQGGPFLVRGVAYGTFAPRRDGQLFPESDQIHRDFSLMRLAGINTVRTYTAPPPDLLDVAAACGLYVVAGLAWSQHVAFLDNRDLCREIRRSIVADVRSIGAHPALLLTAVGNEIPPPIVRWHGRRRIERFLADLCDDVRNAAPTALLTYVNYPPTEFLELPFIDVHAFNVYLHDEAALRTYVAHLHHITAGKPLLLTECGADSRRHGEEGQAALASMQLRAAFIEGACGAIVFAWTDEWWRGGAPIDNWSFGLVDRQRKPKTAYVAVTDVFRTAPFQSDVEQRWPTVSVVVCAYNAAATIDDCLSALGGLDYPRVSVIVVDDGSSDDTAARARTHPGVRLIQTANNGLSTARNIGMQAVDCEVIAYVDADVRVEPSWLRYLMRPFMVSDVVAAGGPNLAPADDGWFAQCVARSPGGPTHVLLDDRIAEHIPGCNFAVRREALVAIGGFDPIFLQAGDDVDVCWRLQNAGGRIAFAPSALVWHHHRTRLSAYWRQQVGYGEGEAWLRLRHAGRFSRSHVAWRGRIYSALPFVRSLSAVRLHSGVWGTAAFPSVYHTSAHSLRALPHTPAWLLTGPLLLLGGLLTLAVRATSPVPSIAIAAGALTSALTLFSCAMYGWRSDIDDLPTIYRAGPGLSRFMYRSVIAVLHVVQPAARAYGYIRGVLRPPAAVTANAAAAPGISGVSASHDGPGHFGLLVRASGHCCFWSERWTSADALLARIVDRLRLGRIGREIRVDDGWQPNRDVSVPLGVWAWAHLKAVVEEHGGGRCLLRARVQIRPRVGTLALTALLFGSACFAADIGTVTLASVVASCAAIALGAVAWIVSRDAGQVFDVVAGVASDCGMLRMPQTEHHQRRRGLRDRDLAGAVIEHRHGLSRDTVGE